METESASLVPHMSLATVLLLVTAVLCHAAYKAIMKDYRFFISLGPGGTPQTALGYLRIAFLRLFALRNPFKAPPVPSSLEFQHGILSKDLQKRILPRPRVAGIAPHRQMTQRSSPEMYAQLSNLVKQIGADAPERFALATSCFEKHSVGLFAIPIKANRNLTCRGQGEICHSHPSDGSMHLTLHPADARVLIEKGWGEMHPLARGNWWWRVKFVPETFVMVYAPQTEEDLKTLKEIILAAAWWVSGKDFKEMNDSTATSKNKINLAKMDGACSDCGGESNTVDLCRRRLI